MEMYITGRQTGEYTKECIQKVDFYQERGNRLKMGHRDLLEHLRDKDRRYYYDHVLVPMPNTTLKDFI